ncbi:MAG TPA: ATP-binding protein [Candidatus Saccharimonadales bacterium]|nr:ATP-binding protein [Candidatus Saccharimonadales bacterium]
MKVLPIRRRAKLTVGRIEHERLVSLVNSMADGVIAVDRNLKIVVYNGAALNVLDLNSTIQGKSLVSVFHPISQHNYPVDVEQYVKNVKASKIDRDLRLKYTDGSFVNLFISVTPVYRGFAKGGQDGYVLVVRDISKEKSLEEERDEFISVISHELRTPIAIAEGNISNAQFVADKTADITEVKKSLAQAHDQVLFLSAMVNDLSMLSRAERGKLTVDIEQINIKDLINSLISDYRPQAESKSLLLTADIGDDVNSLNSSKLYVHEILQNFITNALKYTHEGSITVRADIKDKGMLFQVTDTGIGISHGDQEKLFHKFFRSEDYRTRSTGGTGLGLYVTKKLASLLHAEITVESKLNHGSTFSIYIPNTN